ncbi:hypothetical protein C8J56DRAFT_793345, partial [Mycena floridula]
LSPHNSQGRSLGAATVHLESCTSIAAAYVMLSRIKCGTERPRGLAILGDVSAGKIYSHAPQEVRDEEKRLRRLARKTLNEAKESLRWYSELTGENWE